MLKQCAKPISVLWINNGYEAQCEAVAYHDSGPHDMVQLKGPWVGTMLVNELEIYQVPKSEWHNHMADLKRV